MAAPKPCCPEGSLPPLAEPAAYKPAGAVETVGTLSCYVTGETSTGRGILMAHDVFGVDSGRTRLIADEFARSLDAVVVLPDFWADSDIGSGYFGSAQGSAAANDALQQAFSPMDSQQLSWFTWPVRMLAGLWHSPNMLRGIRSRPWSGRLERQVEDEILPMMRERGVERTGLVGFCWGGELRSQLASLAPCPCPSP